MSLPAPCELCEALSGRALRRCLHCGLFVCRSCWESRCRCQPGHEIRECEDWQRIRMMRRESRLGLPAVRDYLDRLQAMTAEALGENPRARLEAGPWEWQPETGAWVKVGAAAEEGRA